MNNPTAGTSHLGASTLNELHEFAKSIGLKRDSFMDKPGFPHYNLQGAMVDRAKSRGAEVLEQRAFLTFLKETYK